MLSTKKASSFLSFSKSHLKGNKKNIILNYMLHRKKKNKESVRLTGIVWRLIQKSTEMVPPFLRFSFFLLFGMSKGISNLLAVAVAAHGRCPTLKIHKRKFLKLA